MSASTKHSGEPGNARFKQEAELSRALREAYESVLSEPCPDHMLKLLDQLRSKEAEQGKSPD